MGPTLACAFSVIGLWVLTNIWLYIFWTSRNRGLSYPIPIPNPNPIPGVCLWVTLECLTRMGLKLGPKLAFWAVGLHTQHWQWLGFFFSLLGLRTLGLDRNKMQCNYWVNDSAIKIRDEFEKILLAKPKCCKIPQNCSWA